MSHDKKGRNVNNPKKKLRMEEADSDLEKKGSTTVDDWTVLVEGFLLLPVCAAGFLLNIVR